jgi:glycosyltransferase involved in cell wall biosynthesis
VEHVHVLADRITETSSSSDGRVTVHRCWTFNGIDQPIAVARLARALEVDALWCNLHLTSAGNNRASWFAGFLTPLAAKCAGITTVVTLHNMLGFTDVRWAGPETNIVDQLGAHFATALLRPVNVVCVLVPEYVAALRRYGLTRIRLMPLGTLGTPADSPVTSDRSGSLLAFGHFGSYKRLEDLIEVMSDFPDSRLSIAGSDSRHSPGYIAGLAQRCRRTRNVVFLGYIPESDVSRVFRSASLCILPYATTSGISSVAIQAAMHGVPIVASDIPGFRSMSNRGLRMNFFTWGDKKSLKRTIAATLAASRSRHEDALHNLEYCRRQTMSVVVDDYLDLVEGELAARSGASTEAAPVRDPSVVGSK